MLVKLGDAFTIGSGGTPSKQHPEYYGGSIPWVKTGDLGEQYIYSVDECITEEGLKNSSARLYAPDTVLVAMYGATIGATSILKISACTNQACAAFLTNNEVIPEYLYYFLLSKKQRFVQDGVGGAQPNISATYLKGVLFPLRTYDEQSAIVDKLSRVTEVIKQRKHQLHVLNQLIKARFIEMFGTEQEADRWPSCVVADVADVTVGVVIQPTQYYCDYGVPAFRSLNVREMAVNDNDWVYFTEEGQAKNQKSIIRENDVLVVRSGAPGVACVATAKYAGYNAVDIIIAHPCMEKVNPVFLAMFTNMPHGMNQIRAKTGGAAQQHYNVGGYKELRLILPPLDLQNEFATFVSQVDKSKLTIQASLDQLEALKQSLMQKYFG